MQPRLHDGALLLSRGPRIRRLDEDEFSGERCILPPALEGDQRSEPRRCNAPPSVALLLLSILEHEVVAAFDERDRPRFENALAAIVDLFDGSSRRRG